MKRKKIISKIFLTSFILLNAGCEKNKVTDTVSVTTNLNAKFLSYMEEQGDIINTQSVPVIQAEEVYTELNTSLILDIRIKSGYAKRHITGSKSISVDTIFDYITANHTKFKKIILVSASGQSAAYFTALLRLGGFTNVYYLNYGLASWHRLFSSVWTDRLDSLLKPNISHEQFPKLDYSPLPSLSQNSTGKTLEDLLHQRIKVVISEGFNEDYTYGNSKTAMTFLTWNNSLVKPYLVCLGPLILYSSNKKESNTYHPPGAVSYLIPPDLSDLRSISNLQTIPSYGTIALYSATGLESAYYTAYLRLLGYDAKSILFGMNNIDYGMLIRTQLLSQYAFTDTSIKNYPYSVGPGTK